MKRREAMGRTLEQILADEKPEVVAEAKALAEETLLNIHLAELREKVQKTQVEMAQVLNIKQPTVAGMEKPGRDLKLSTLKRYIEAAGGKLRLDIELPDGSHYEFVV
jgi:DNA-binding XRE family transcriptional regulator